MDDEIKEEVVEVKLIDEKDTCVMLYPVDKYHPKKVKLTNFTHTHSKLYYPREKGSIIITMRDSDNLVGSSKCSVCNSSVNIGDRFCHECGSRLVDKILAWIDTC